MAHERVMSNGQSGPPPAAAGAGTANMPGTTPWPISRAASSHRPAAMSRDSSHRIVPPIAATTKAHGRMPTIVFTTSCLPSRPDSRP
jgi:hypothetical protein